MKARVDRFNLILGCPYDGEMLGVVSAPLSGDTVPIAALHSYGGNPIVGENDVLRCSKCQQTFLVTGVIWDEISEVTLLAVP